MSPRISPSAARPERLVREVEQRLGRVDVLVNNVGVAYQRTFEEVTDDQWDELWQLNVMSYVRMIRAVLPGMKERGSGVIVNVSSTAGKRPSASMPDYSVTKAAVLSVSRLVADVYAKDGIRCNAVTPGPTATAAWLADGGLADQQAERSGKSRDEVLAAVGAGRPLGRLAEPEEIASVVAFLCSRARATSPAQRGAPTGELSRSSSSCRCIVYLARCRRPPVALLTPSTSLVREHEEQWLSPLAVRSYESRGRNLPEEECRLRTPFQRDRDRDRPLEGVPPAPPQDAGLRRPGRRPLPHAADAHARDDRHRARRRARTAPERGSRRGDRPRPRPRAPAVRPRRRAGARRGGARTRRPRLPAQRAFAACRRAPRARRPRAQPDVGGARRHPQAHRCRSSRRRSRARSCASSTASPTSTTTSTTPSAPASSTRLSCRRTELRVLGQSGSRRIDTLVHDLVETSAQAGDIAQSDEIGGAMLSLRSFMFEHVYLGPHSADEHAQIRTTIRRIFAAPRGRARRRRRARDRLPRGHDRPLRARLRSGSRLMARIKDSSVEAVKSAAEILPLVEDYVRLRKAGGTYKGLCPFHQERTPSFTVTPARGTFKCFGCGEGGDAITFVDEDGAGRLRRCDRVAREALRRPDRVRGDLAGGGAGAAAQGSPDAAARAGDSLLRARALGQRAGAVRARVPRVARPARGGLPRRSGSASRPAGRR